MTVFHIHIRDHDEEGELLNFGGATIAYEVERLSDKFRIKFSVSECCDTDRFVKQIGRDIASSRLIHGEIMGKFEVEFSEDEDIERMIIEEYLAYKATYWSLIYEGDIKNYWFPHKGAYTRELLNDIEDE